MIVSRRLDRRIPGALIAMVLSIALVGALNLQAHGVAVLGTIHTGAPHFGLAGLSWSALRSLVPLSAVVALVVVTQTAATSRAFADRGGYDADAGRDFLGVGAGSVLAGLVGSFPVDASPPRTGAVVTAGGRTQAGPLGAAAVVLVLIPFANVLRDVPLAALSAILIFVAVHLFDARGLEAIARFNWLEFGLAAVTLLTVVLVGVQQGIAVAVVLAILDRIRISARPQLHELGRVPGTTSWARPTFEPRATTLPGVLVVMFATPIWYANASRFEDEVHDALAAAAPVRVLVLDTIGMSDVDYTGTRALAQVVDACQRQGIAFGVARPGAHLRQSLRRCGLASRIGEDHFFLTVDEAVKTLAHDPPDDPGHGPDPGSGT
jgi:MFS superfamily sulfate permease-like transporter